VRETPNERLPASGYIWLSGVTLTAKIARRSLRRAKPFSPRMLKRPDSLECLFPDKESYA